MLPREDSKADFSQQMKKGMEVPCPKCREPMHMAASRCPSCKAEFSAEEVKQNIAGKRANTVGCIGILMTVTLGAVVILSLSSRSDRSDEEAAQPFEQQVPYWKEAAEDVVRQKLRDPDSAVFSNLEVFEGGAQSATIICGKVNSRNGFGGMTGPQRFIAGGTVMLEEDFTPTQMEAAWAKFCHTQ